MNILKKMEAVFVVTLGLAFSASYVLETLPQEPARSGAAPGASAAMTGPMPVVVISAKRMSAAEKQQSLRDERPFAALRHALANRT